MQVFLKTASGDTICLEVDKEDAPVIVWAKITDIGCSVFNWHINWRSPQIFVLTTVTEKKFCLGYNCCDTISDLKSKISNTEGIPSNEQILFFAGMILENSSPISRYNISQGSTLNLVHTSRGYMSISVMTHSGEAISMMVHRQFSVRRVKKMIEHKIGGLDGKRLVNVYAGEELLDKQSLYLIEDGARLHLVDDAQMASTIEMKLYVKIFPGRKTIELDVANIDTINKVKHIIQQKEGIPVDLQVIYLPQKRLEDTFTLADYYIFDKTTLSLVLIPEQQRP